MARSTDGDSGDAVGREIRLVENPDGRWTARDLAVGISVQGPSRSEALETLDDVVEAVTATGGHVPSDEELRELGVDPEVARSDEGELPDVLK